MLTLKLNADGVVLSACNTTAADGKAEEALSGLARGFFYAGSRSLLVTHRAVDSESAKLLTTATFEHYTANPQAAKAESLRQAMLKVMAMPRYSHPAYWAPCALVGDGGSEWSRADENRLYAAVRMRNSVARATGSTCR